ncbi:MAG: hypothetical protein ACK51L_00835 [bacterium]
MTYISVLPSNYDKKRTRRSCVKLRRRAEMSEQGEFNHDNDLTHER